MIGTLALKTAPSTEPVTTAELKLQSRVDISDDDTLLTNMGVAARRWIEDITGIRMVSQTWYYYLDCFPAESLIELPIGPTSAVVGITYTKEDATSGTVAASTYVTDLASLSARIVLKDGESWPADTLTPVNGVRIEFTAGYGLAAVVPEELKLAVKLLAAHWYENREECTTQRLESLPMGIKALIANFKARQAN